MWHPDRYRNSVIHDPRPPVEGAEGSSLIQHLAHVARRPDVWYVPNGWLYCYRYVAEHAQVGGAIGLSADLRKYRIVVTETAAWACPALGCGRGCACQLAAGIEFSPPTSNHNPPHLH